LFSETLWKHCLRQLESDLSMDELNTWIRPLQAYHQNGTLSILAPNRYVRDEVQRRFDTRINEIVSSLMKPEQVAVTYEVGSQSYDDEASQPQSGFSNTPPAQNNTVRNGASSSGEELVPSSMPAI